MKGDRAKSSLPGVDDMVWNEEKARVIHILRAREKISLHFWSSHRVTWAPSISRIKCCKVRRGRLPVICHSGLLMSLASCLGSTTPESRVFAQNMHRKKNSFYEVIASLKGVAQSSGCSFRRPWNKRDLLFLQIHLNAASQTWSSNQISSCALCRLAALNVDIKSGGTSKSLFLWGLILKELRILIVSFYRLWALYLTTPSKKPWWSACECDCFLKGFSLLSGNFWRNLTALTRVLVRYDVTLLFLTDTLKCFVRDWNIDCSVSGGASYKLEPS